MYYYNFSLEPSLYQPSGFINFSRINTVEIPRYGDLFNPMYLKVTLPGIINNNENIMCDNDKCYFCCEKIINKILLQPCEHSNVCENCFSECNGSCPICETIIRSIKF